jgi:uncharacterized membrane protein YfcA
MDFFTYVLILLLIGLLVGFLAGLLGIGGGFIMGPVQFWLLSYLGLDPNLAIRVAFATSLTAIIPTAMSGAAGHYLKGAVDLKTALTIGIPSFLAAFLGAIITSKAPASVLSIVFGVVIIILALWMLSSEYPRTNARSRHSTLILVIIGLGTGLLSGVLGIGGGTILIPLLVMIIGCSIHRAVGTSVTVVIFTALGGVISYILNGLNVSGLPPYSLGYVNLLNLIILIIATVPMAQLGVRTSHKLPAQKLKYIYVILMIYIGLRMIGVFSWLHLPI